MICDKCEHEYEIGVKGAYVNIYGTRCPKCKHLIKPDVPAKVIRDAEERKKSLIKEYLPVIRKKIKEEIEE